MGRFRAVFVGSYTIFVAILIFGISNLLVLIIMASRINYQIFDGDQESINCRTMVLSVMCMLWFITFSFFFMDIFLEKETVHQIFGARVAVLAGDFMFAQSSWYLANLENLEVIKFISQVIKDFVSGEIKQASNLFDCDLQLDKYLIKSYYKTTSSIAASTKGAAIFSGVDKETADKMYEFGKNLGLLFLIVDDILDLTQSAKQLGKPAGSDLAKGNLTAPVIFALQKVTKLRDIIESELREPGSLDEAVKLVKSSGGIKRARELAKHHADLAVQNLRCLPQSSLRLALEDMVIYNLKRID